MYELLCIRDQGQLPYIGQVGMRETHMQEKERERERERARARQEQETFETLLVVSPLMGMRVCPVACQTLMIEGE